MGDVIKLRRGRESYWNGAGATVVPAQGETVLIYDDSMTSVIGAKYGNGLAQMQSLPLFAPGGGGGSDYDSADFSTDFSTKTTDDLGEGSTNKYVTQAEKDKLANTPSNTQSELDTLNTALDGKLSAIREQVVTNDASYTAQVTDSGKIVTHTFTGAGDKKLLIGDGLPNGYFSVHTAAGKEMTIEKIGGSVFTLVYDGYKINSGDSFFIIKGSTGTNQVWVIRTSPAPEQVRDKLSSLPSGSKLSYNDLDDTPVGLGYDTDDFNTDLATKTSDDVTEGVTNIYVTPTEKGKIANLPSDTTTELANFTSQVQGKVDKIRQNATVSAAEYTLQNTLSMHVLIHQYNGGLAQKLLIDDSLPNGFSSQHIVENKEITVELAPGATDTLVYDGEPFQPGESFIVHKVEGVTDVVYVLRFQVSPTLIAAALTSDDISEGAANKYISAADEGKIANLPSDTIQDIDDASKHNSVALTTSATVTPADHDTYYIYETAGDITLTFEEDLSESPQLPTAIIIRTYPGSGDILLESDSGNTLPLEFRHNGSVVNLLPGNGNNLYGLLLKPGTSIIEIDAKNGTPIVSGQQVALVPTSVHTFPAAVDDRSTDPLETNYELDMDSHSNPTLWVIASGTDGGAGTAFTGMTAGGVAMNQVFNGMASYATFTKNLQIYMLPASTAPADGSILIKAGEDATSTENNRMLSVFVVENSSQTIPTPLSVTSDDVSRDDLRYNEGLATTMSTIMLASIPGKFVAFNFFAAGGGTPFTSDGETLDDIASITWDGRLSKIDGDSEAIEFDCGWASNSHFHQVTFAVKEAI